MKFRTVFLFIVVFILSASVASTFVDSPDEDYTTNHGYSWENYDPEYYLKFQDVQSVIDAADEALGVENRNSLAYYNYIVDIISKRFYHGYTYYSFADNPFASMAGNLAWKHLSAIVLPDDIMKHPKAACSQQAIVLMEIFKRNQVDYRTVQLNGHYCAEAWIDGGWRFFDTNLEADINNLSLESLIASQQLESAYLTASQDVKNIKEIFSSVQYSGLNEPPAPQAMFFHRVCYILNSDFSRLLLISLILIYVAGIPLKQSLVQKPVLQ